MSKKKASPASKKQAKQGIVIVFKTDERVTDEYKAWLRELADKLRLTSAGAVDLALATLADKHDFRRPPKRSLR